VIATQTARYLTSHHETWLVALSVLIAATASFAALDLASRVTASSGRGRLVWLVSGAFAMGLGIWSMHSVGMLAFQLPIPVRYDLITVLLSLVAAAFASLVALWVVSRNHIGPAWAALGGIAMGGGIATMHYTGMAAMRLSATVSYDPLLLAASVLLAILISVGALWLGFLLRDPTASWWGGYESWGRPR